MRIARIIAAAFIGLICLPPASEADPVKLRVAWVAAPGELPSILAFKKDVAKHWDKSYSYSDVHFQGTPPMITALSAG